MGEDPSRSRDASLDRLPRSRLDEGASGAAGCGRRGGFFEGERGEGEGAGELTSYGLIWGVDEGGGGRSFSDDELTNDLMGSEFGISWAI